MKKYAICLEIIIYLNWGTIIILVYTSKEAPFTMQKSVLQNIEKWQGYGQKKLRKIPLLAVLPFFEGFWPLLVQFLKLYKTDF